MNDDNQVCEPDNNVEIMEVNPQPPRLTDLEIMRQLYEAQMPLCAEMMSNSSRERERVQQELAKARQRREEKLNVLDAIGRNGEETVQGLLTAKFRHDHFKSRFMEERERLNNERNWQPTVEMSDEDLKALTATVERLRAEKKRRCLDGGGLPTANS